MRITTTELASLNERFRESRPLDILRFAHEVFGPRVAILSSMQRGGTALCHLADRNGLSFDVLFVDTGVLHHETLLTRDALVAAHPRMRVRTLTPTQTFTEQTAAEGLLYLTREGQERCCELRKRDPLLSMKGQYDALIGALRREEGGARATVQTFDIDAGMNALRIHPYAWRPRAELDAYFAEHPDTIKHPLHAMGYPKIGCFPCTTPVRPDEPERAGRWRHLATVEYCGINPIDRGAQDDGIELPDRYAASLR